MTDVTDADLVLEGGGVKGIAHVGAIVELESAGCRFHRVAGASAGSIAAAFTAATCAAGRKIADIEPLLWSGKSVDSIDYRRVPGGKLPVPGVEQAREVMSLLLREGLFNGDYLRDWLFRTLKARFDVETFSDLRLEDERRDLSKDQQYRLVVMVTDVSRGSLVRLPWDYHLYGLDPDRQYVADALRASASIPFFFQPVRLPWADGSGQVSYLVDGGACSDFPIEVFDRLDGEEPRWPTFGIKLSARPQPGSLVNHVTDTLTLATGLLETVINGNDQVHLADPCVFERTIFVDTSAVGSENFDLTAEQQQWLYAQGSNAARSFLRGWDWASYRTQCAGGPDAQRRARAARGELAPWEALAADNRGRPQLTPGSR